MADVPNRLGQEMEAVTVSRVDYMFASMKLTSDGTSAPHVESLVAVAEDGDRLEVSTDPHGIDRLYKGDGAVLEVRPLWVSRRISPATTVTRRRKTPASSVILN